MSENRVPEPWLRGTLMDVPAVHRGVLHALELAGENLMYWCGPLSDEQLDRSVADIAPVAFHLRHIARSLDRLLTYAEGNALNEQQFAALRSELSCIGRREQLFAELAAALEGSALRVRKLAYASLEEPRMVGQKKFPTTVGGLLVHIADHTQRHVGQAITTAKFVRAQIP
ncbi:MAG TPA: DinB family protein [Candidatus Acidoferrum sp.]|nr:DinB family protein [Candidatus Acidoferrum sp.]